MKTRIFFLAFIGFMMFLIPQAGLTQAKLPVSEETEACLACHATLHPAMVSEWKSSRHANVTPLEALKKDKLARRISNEKLPDLFSKTVVGCAECHTLNSEKHKDTFEHNGLKVHTIVTPNDCATCHPVEVQQYGKNLMSHAYGNLVNNPVYRSLADEVNGIKSFEAMKLTSKPPDLETNLDSCLYCHGSEVKVKGKKSKETSMGEMEFPLLSGWPNQGVGRINPDGSKGACTACHTRHQFSIEMARKPHTCSECHKGPDVPAYPVYEVSKHGNIYKALGKEWNFNSVPWAIGNDLTAPTCATCHVSLTVSSESGEVIAERTHQMNDRLAWRLMGLIYAHPHPKSPDTTLIKNKAGLPLPTELTGEPVPQFLIDSKEQATRTAALQKVCLACHSGQWVRGRFTRFENTLKTTNEMTLTATKILLSAWEKGAAKGLAQKDSLFNEAIERKWVEQWLFYANSTRFASAMMGADYGVFANGRWYLSKNIQEMLDWLEFKLQKKSQEKKK
ncbi:MAG: multiheme c-type cytochrome [Thermodesulfobacteriota bacterium]